MTDWNKLCWCSKCQKFRTKSLQKTGKRGQLLCIDCGMILRTKPRNASSPILRDKNRGKYS